MRSVDSQLIVRPYRHALTTLVTSFTMCKVDYCNVALAGLPQYELDRVHHHHHHHHIYFP